MSFIMQLNSENTDHPIGSSPNGSKPFVMGSTVGLNEIYNESCFDTMSRMPDKFVDLIVTDPPYGIGLEYDTYVDTEEAWFELFDKLIPECIRVAKMVILPCCRIKALPHIYQTKPPDWLICWYKGSPGHRSFIGFNDWEPLLVYGKTDGCQMHDYFAFNNIEKMGNYGHPCPKPIKWSKWLIARASKEGNLIYDPFMGSGTTAIAAHEMKRNWIGSEISEKYCLGIKKRLAPYLAQTSLF